MHLGDKRSVPWWPAAGIRRIRGGAGAASGLPIPRGLTEIEEAAGLPETYFTVWKQRVPTSAAWRPAKRCGARRPARGIGTTGTIQLARAMATGLRHGGQRTNGARAPSKRWAPRLGINYKTQD
ncbi:hypothetical protein ACL7DC_16300 [Bordetella pertussis]